MSIKAWNDEQEQELIRLYTSDNGIKDIDELATYFEKRRRSVISKLVQLNLYIKEDKNNNKKKRTVKTMLRDLEEILNIQIEGTNLNKKSNLMLLVDAIERRLKEETD